MNHASSEPNEILRRRLSIDTVPNGWLLTTVGKVCRIENHLRLPLSTDVRASMQGEYPYYGPTGILSWIDGYRVEGSFALIGEDGDHFIDFQNKPQTLRVHGRLNVNNHAHIVRGTDRCETDWFSYFFQHRDIFHSLTRQGAGRFKLTKAALENLPILLPPIGEQRKLIQLMADWDVGIVKAKRRASAMKERHRALVAAVIPASGHRAGWHETRFGDLIDERGERTQSHDSYPALTSSRDGITLQSDYYSKAVTSKDTTGYKVVRRGDFAFRSMSDDGVFAFNQQNILDAGLISPAYGVFRCRSNDAFFRHFLNSEAFLRKVRAEAQGGTRLSLRLSALKATMVLVPGAGDQETIGAFLDDSARAVALADSQVTVMIKQKRGLMQNLLNGRLRVEGIK